jgi:hypothetical protein
MILETPCDELPSIRQQGGCQAVALEADQGFVIEGEGKRRISVDEAAPLQTVGCHD